MTLVVAFDVLPVPASVEDTVTELFFAPAVVPVTSTLKVQEAPAASVAPARLTLDEPAVAVIVPPPQLPTRPFGVATTRPAGRLSVNATPVKATVVLGLVTSKVSVVDSLSRI